MPHRGDGGAPMWHNALERLLPVDIFPPLHDVIDEEGRPLLEMASSSYQTSMRHEIPCPYRDRRHHQEMNQAALQQVSRYWDDIKQTLSWLAGPSASLYRAWRASLIATLAPAQALSLHPDKLMSAPIAALYKAALGYAQCFTYLALATDGVADMPLSALGTPKEFLEWLNTELWLVGDQQVCAGSPSMIAQLFLALSDAPEIIEPPHIWRDLPRDESYWDEQIDRVVLTVAHLSKVQRDDLAGAHLSIADRALLEDPPISSLYVVTLNPKRDPADAQRLYPRDVTSERLSAYLRGEDYWSLVRGGDPTSAYL